MHIFLPGRIHIGLSLGDFLFLGDTRELTVAYGNDLVNKGTLFSLVLCLLLRPLLLIKENSLNVFKC